MASTTRARVQRPEPARRRGRRRRRYGQRGYYGRRGRLLTRTLPLLAALGGLAVVAFLFGSYEAGAAGRAERSLVKRYVADWSHSNWAAMYKLLSPGAQRQISQSAFTAECLNAANTATTKSLRFSTNHIRISHGVARVPAVIGTSTFGTLQETLTLALGADHNHVLYRPAMVFPGLRGAEKLRRTSRLGARGTLLADDGTPLAEGPGRTSPIPDVADQIVGTLGPIPAAEKGYYRSLGYPSGAQVGQDGLELIFQKQLAGTPGGTLLAGKRKLASTAPVKGATVRTTIDPKLETAALAAIGSGYAGMTVLNQQTGAIEAAVGLGFSDLQPPGSTFKIVTATAALTDHVATPSTTFPEESQADVGGYEMQNAGGEVCGGTLFEAFVTSCDTTFAPLGISIGAKRLVSMAEKFGFNQPTGIPSALESTIPSAATIGDDTAVGSTAIGQGDLEASTLEMADVAATIADHGQRPLPTLRYGAKPRYVTVTTPKVAAEIQAMMIGVVNDSGGTGTSAAIPGVTVAGKTGTAELANTGGQQNDTKETDAWFVGYAPNSKTKVVACALFPANGYGADSAAPAVRSLLEAALGIS